MVELSSVQQELERITSEKLALEAKVTELAPYQTEVMALRGEVQKLQVCWNVNISVNVLKVFTNRRKWQHTVVEVI